MSITRFNKGGANQEIGYVTVGNVGSNADYICDGVDDEVQIQEAMDDIGASGGGTVQLLDGVFNINAVIVPAANVELKGSGKNVTILKPQTGTAATNIFYYGNTTILENYSMSDFTIDLDGQAVGGGQIFWFNGLHIHDIEVKDIDAGTTSRWGMRLGWIDSISVGTINRARTSNIATITTDADHGYVVGDIVRVSAMADSTYDQEYVEILTVPTTTSYTYNNTGVDEATTADTGGLSTKYDEASRSYNLRLHHCDFINNDSHTFETILLPNVQGADIYGNYFKGNVSTTDNYDEVSIFGFCSDILYHDNIHEESKFFGVGMKDSLRIKIYNNTINRATQTNKYGIRCYNSKDCSVYGNTITNSNSAGDSGIFLSNRNLGLDGHPIRFEISENLKVYNNKIIDSYYAINGTNGSGTITLKYHNLEISRNEIVNTSKAPIRIGNEQSDSDFDTIFITDNKIYSWTGNFEAGIYLRGDSSNPQLMKNVYIERNYIASNTVGATSGGIRVFGAEVKTIKDNQFGNTFGSWGAIDITTGGSVENIYDNYGYIDNQPNIITATAQTLKIGTNLINVVSANTQSLDGTLYQAGDVITVVDLSGNATTNNITIDTAGVETIDGSATTAITTNYGAIDFLFDGVNFLILRMKP